jgi:CPA1 family monovalent cation:H+ antiporter
MENLEPIVRVEILILILLLVASVVSIVVRRFRIPYTVALVIVGSALSLQSSVDIELSPRLFLLFFLPPLLFDAAFHLNIHDLRRNFWTIALLAVPGVILNTLMVGGVVAWGAGLSIGIALIFGALIAATDPVAVVSIFKKLGAPRRLTVLLEGESLFNDGTAIVIFELAVAAVLTGDFNLLEGVGDFIRVAGVGIAVGLSLGWLTSLLVARIDDHLVETTLTTVLAFGSFFVAEELLHASGVLAVVIAGLVTGNIGPKGMSPTTRIVVFNFWEYIAFLANSAVFLLIGFQIDFPALLSNWQTILWAILAVLVSRAVVIYLGSGIRQDVRMNWRHILFWGGLRGGIALTLALSLPLEIGPERSTITAMAFGVVLFTLLAQGISMGWLLERLKIIFRSEGQLEYERRHARALASRAGYEHLEELHTIGLISSHTWENIRGVVGDRVEALTGAVQDALHDSPELEIEELISARRRELRSQRSMLGDLRFEGVVSDEVHDELVGEIDQALESGIEGWAQRILADHIVPNVRQLLFVVIQQKDLESTFSALSAQGIPVTHISSSGGYLRKPNNLLVVGIPEGKLDQVVDTLEKSTSGMVDFQTGLIEDLPIAAGAPIPIKVLGATVFAFDVERYEEIIS